MRWKYTEKLQHAAELNSTNEKSTKNEYQKAINSNMLTQNFIHYSNM